MISRSSTAYHEAGHCLGFRFFGIPIEKATIVPSHRYAGCVTAPDITLWEHQAVIDLLGHAAELEFGFADSYRLFNYTEDYAHALENIKRPMKYKRSDEWALVHGYVHKEIDYYEFEGKQEIRHEKGQPKFIYGRYDFRLTSDYRSWMKATRLRKEDWKPSYDRIRRKARRLAKKHRAYIEKVATLLMDHSTLTDDMIPQLVMERRRAA
jgi:ATP-dependent Zn protease